MPRRPLFPLFALTLLAAGLAPTVIRDAGATVPRAPLERAPAVEEPR